MPNRNWSGLRGRITRRKSDLNDDDVYDENTPGCWKLKDHASAGRTLQWVKKKIRKGRRGKFPIFEGAVREVEGGRFQIDAFKTSRNGKRDRVS